MVTLFLRVVTLTLPVCLASCNPPPPPQANAADCLSLPVLTPPGVTDLMQDVHACVERNAAMYARGPDSPAAISEAVVAKCERAIIRYVEQEARAAGEQPNYSEAMEAWRRHALPAIAEARARAVTADR